MFKKNYSLLFFLSFLLNTVYGQFEPLEYSKNLTISDGLAHNGVTSIFEDSKGFVWVGTYDGLNKYDGYKLKTYKNTIEDEILVSNRIRDIEEDNKGNIWLGTDEGITIFNPVKEKFTQLYSDRMYNNRNSGPIIRKIIVNKHKKNILCITEDKGVLIFDEDLELINHLMLPNELLKDNIEFFDAVGIGNSWYLIASSSGLIAFNKTTGEFKQTLRKHIKYSSSLTKLNKNTLLVCLRTGIAIVEVINDKKEISSSLISKHFKSEQFKTAKLDYLGNLWLGKLNSGIIHLDSFEALRNNEKVIYKEYQIKPSLLRSSCFEISKKSGCWAGTFDKGIFRFDLKNKPFINYNPSVITNYGITSTSINSVSALNEDKVLLTATRSGISMLDTKTNEFKALPFNASDSFKRGVSNVFIDSKKNIWLKKNTGKLFRVKNGSKKPVLMFEESEEFSFTGLRKIIEDKWGDLWFCCDDNVYRIKIRKDKIVNIESLGKNLFFKTKGFTMARNIYPDPLYNIIWIADSDDGLFRIEIDKKTPLKNAKVTQYVYEKNNEFSLSSNFVTCLTRLPNGDLWLGTEGGGICKVVDSDTSPKFLSFSEKEGLSNNVVKSIVADKENNLWIGTNIGLNKFNTKDLSFRKFSKEDGIRFEDFWYASEKLVNGNIFFSGLDGYFYFNPHDIKNKEILPKLEFGDFSLFNKIVNPGDTIAGRVLLNEHLNENQKIQLEYNENVFSVETISLHFSNPKTHLLRYKLAPLNENWVEVPSNNKSIGFSGLQPGNYKLSVMASNAVNNWTEPKELDVIISPPFWKTNLANVLYFLAFCLFTYFVNVVVLKIQNLNHKIEIEQLEVDNVKEVNAAKLRFFSNVSHEIKTPLTLISGPVEALLSQGSLAENVKSKLNIVQRQSKKISQLIDQVHDFQRSDANKLKMNYTKFCLDNFIKELVFDFRFLAEKENKILDIVGAKEKIYVSADKDKLEKICNNLLNNSFKYTDAGDTIKIEYKSIGKELTISCADTGKGIEKVDLPHIFERFYQSKKKHGEYTGGSGIGLAFTKRLVEMHYGYIDAESEVNQGTTITTRLPIVIDEVVLDEEEIKNEILSYEKEFSSNDLIVGHVDFSKIKTDKTFHKSKIFFAEDNADMRAFVHDILANFFEVVTFNNGKECLERLKDEWPDLVLSDVLMPELNGFELCKAIKSDIKTSHIPVVLLTACTSIEDQIQGIDDGADAYIKKPFNTQRLVSRIESLMKNRKQLRERFKIDFPHQLEKNDERGAKDSVFLEKLYALMDENLDNQEMDMNELAKKLYLNRTHFYQKVKAITNKTPFELLKEFRLKKAAEFLVQKKMTVNEVFIVTGFKSRSHFSKLFKEKYNLTPGKYVSEGFKSIENKDVDNS